MRRVAPIAAALVASAGLAVFWLERRGGHEAVASALWWALQLVAVAAAILEAPRHPPATPRPRLGTALLRGALALVAALAVGWDLSTVPRNVHNDVGATVEAARAIVDGRHGFFQPGYAEIPGPGSLPTLLSLHLFGNTMAGGRAGAAALGVVAVLGVFALGRELRNERTGFLAGLLLCGSVPFVHYSRLTPFGEVAAFSVWLLWAVLRAARANRPAAWLAAGVLGGWGFLLFYSARVSLLGAVAGAGLLLARPLRQAPRRIALFSFFVLGAGAVVSPVLPVWLARPESFFHRTADSFSLYDPVSGFHPEVVGRVFGEPTLRTLSMFWPVLSPERGVDLAGQGTPDAAMGPVEGILLLAGLLVTLADGIEAAAPVVWLVVMLLGCGVFAQATPWYSRLVPVVTVAALLVARAVDAFVGLVARNGRVRRLASTAAASAILLSVTFPNVFRYVRSEERQPPTIYTAFRLEADRLPAGTRILCVTFERPDFTCRNPSFGPFLARPLTEDAADLGDVLPVPAGRPTAFFVPFERFVPDPRDPELLVEEIRRAHPAAAVVRTGSLPDDPGRPLGVVVLVGAGATPPPPDDARLQAGSG
jgi:4-amino-4-deoxy-L-arabinose transferase-like glycosyltransferase